MLARVAERIYWLGRYMERAENTARLVSVYSNLLLDLPRGTRIGWETLIDIAGCNKSFQEKFQNTDERSVIRFLLADTSNPVSILSSLSSARENARTAREIIPSEAWEQINNLYLHAKESSTKGIARNERHRLLQYIIMHIQQFTGLMAGTMSHNHAYDFIRLGRNLERADMTTRIVDVGSGNLLPQLSHTELEINTLETYNNILWMSVLRSLSAYQMYRQNVQNRINPEDVVAFLLQNSEFPRAVLHSLVEVEACVQKFPNNEDTLRAIASTQRRVKEANIIELLNDSNRLHAFIDQLQLEIATAHNQITLTWFLPVTDLT